MTKSQMIDRHLEKIGENYLYIKYVYLYVDDKDKTAIKRKHGDFKGYSKIGKSVCKTIRTGDNTLWSWEAIYQKIDNSNEKEN